jgi:hypothetical protein
MLVWIGFPHREIARKKINPQGWWHMDEGKTALVFIRAIRPSCNPSEPCNP